MLSAQHRQHWTLYVATTSLVAFANAVDALPKSSLKSKKPTTTGNGGGGSNSCYDSQGTLITCPISKTQWIVIAVLGGLVVLVVLILVIHCAVRRRIEASFTSMDKDTKGAHQKVPLEEEPTLPLVHKDASAYDPDQKQAGGITESEKSEESEESESEKEKLHSTTPYDPVYPSQQYDHPYSDSASIASSVYHAPPVTHAHPQDYSYQHYYNTNVTAQPEMRATSPTPSLEVHARRLDR